jgi:hypothetical protein
MSVSQTLKKKPLATFSNKFFSCWVEFCLFFTVANFLFLRLSILYRGILNRRKIKVVEFWFFFNKRCNVLFSSKNFLRLILVNVFCDLFSEASWRCLDVRSKVCTANSLLYSREQQLLLWACTMKYEPHWGVARVKLNLLGDAACESKKISCEE